MSTLDYQQYLNTLECEHEFRSVHHRYLNPFGSGKRCSRCGLEVSEDNEQEETEEEE